MYFLFLLALVAAVSANCPVVKPVDNFNFSDYGNGIWYEVARYPSVAEKDSVCGHAEFKVEGDQIKVKNYYVRNNKAGSIEGFAAPVPDAGQSGKILYSLPYGKHGPIEHVVDVLAVVYDKYLIEYICKYDEASQKIKEFAWVFSRSKVLPDDDKIAVEKFLKNSEVLDSSRFEWPSFSDEDCKVNA